MRIFQKGFWYDVELASRVTGKGDVAKSEQLVLAITKNRKAEEELLRNIYRFN